MTSDNAVDQDADPGTSAAIGSTSADLVAAIGSTAPTGLVATKTATAEANDRTVLLQLGGAGDSGLAPGDLAAAAGLAPRTTSAVVGRLVSQGMAIRNGKSRVLITVAGRTQLGAGLVGKNLTPALDRAIRELPAEGLQAFTRLVLSGVVARHHLGDFLEDGWGSFMVIGPTNTGKTTIAKFVCEVFDLKRAQTILNVPAETAESLWARRSQVEGGGMISVPSPALGRAFLCLDEFDKASSDLRRSMLRLVQGDTRVAGDGDQILEVRPTVMLCANFPSPDKIPAEYRRRSVVLDTAPLEPLLRDLPTVNERLFAGAIPHLSLDKCRPPGELPQDVRDELRRALGELLTERGFRQCDQRAIQRMTLGRAGLTGSSDLRGAAMATVADYWVCAQTVGEGRLAPPAWFIELLGGAMIPNLPAAVDQSDIHERSLRARSTDDLALVEARERTATQLRLIAKSIERVPQADQPEAAGLRKVLRKVADDIGKKRTAAGHQHLVEVARDPARRAVALRSRLDEEQRAKELERERDREDRERDRRQVTSDRELSRAATRNGNQVARANRQVAAENLKVVRQAAVEVERLYRRKGLSKGGPKPLQTMLAVELPDGVPLIRYRSPPADEPLPPGSGFGAKVRRALAPLPMGEWISGIDDNFAVRATQHGLPALDQWGTPSRHLLRPAVYWLQEWESHWEREAGRKPRAGRLLLE